MENLQNEILDLLTRYDIEDLNKSNDLYLRRNLFLLNDLLDVRFRRSHIDTDSTNETNLVRTYETNINELLLHILNQLIEPPMNIGDTVTSALTSLRYI